jgi:hypothetical protein
VKLSFGKKKDGQEPDREAAAAKLAAASDAAKPDTPATDPLVEQEGHAPDVDEVMRKYDRESRTRNWVGLPRKIVAATLAVFSVYCIGMTLFATILPETRLSLFLGFVVIVG